MTDLHIASPISPSNNMRRVSTGTQVPPSKLRRILAEVSSDHELRGDLILNPPYRDTYKRISVTPYYAAMHDLMWRLRQEGHSFPAIGKAVGRNHASVINGVSRHRERMG